MYTHKYISYSLTYIYTRVCAPASQADLRRLGLALCPHLTTWVLWPANVVRIQRLVSNLSPFRGVSILSCSALAKMLPLDAALQAPLQTLTFRVKKHHFPVRDVAVNDVQGDGIISPLRVRPSAPHTPWWYRGLVPSVARASTSSLVVQFCLTTSFGGFSALLLPSVVTRYTLKTPREISTCTEVDDLLILREIFIPEDIPW